MLKLIKKILPAIFFWGIFTYVLFSVPYPQTLTEANALQISLFFIPLFLALTFTFNVFAALGIIFLLTLKALDSLNIVTGGVTIISIGLLISYFRKIKKNNLTKLPKIPKLSKLRKQ